MISQDLGVGQNRPVSALNLQQYAPCTKMGINLPHDGATICSQGPVPYIPFGTRLHARRAPQTTPYLILTHAGLQTIRHAIGKHLLQADQDAPC